MTSSLWYAVIAYLDNGVGVGGEGHCLHEHAQWAASIFHVLFPDCDLLLLGGGIFYKGDHRIFFSARDQGPQSPALGQRVA